MTTDPVHIVGGGLAGSEAAWQAAQAGVPVILHEMRGLRGTDAHKTDGLAELATDLDAPLEACWRPVAAPGGV